MNILITGARGFVGQNLTEALRAVRDGRDRTRGVEVGELFLFDTDTDPALLPDFCRRADFVFHLAGVNRPRDPSDFMRGNLGFTTTLLDSKENSKERITTIEDFDLPELLKLSLLQCNITSLKGIQNCPKLQWLDMTYMRSLTDISDLVSLAPTLRMLSIQSCPKITDFSVISNLKELEYLELHGKNELPNLDFIKELPKLKLVNLSMNVIDGDISCLQNIQYADVVCKRQYNLKNKDLSKDRTDLGFKFI